MAEKVFKVFVSSPGDTEHERLLVKGVLERLNASIEGRARLDPLFWEDRFYSAHDTFQSQIAESAQCDVVLAVFRNRLGTPLPENFPRRIPGSGQPFPSGTAYEVLSAIFARRSGQKLPDIFVYRRPEWDWPPLRGDARTAEEIKQEYLRLEAFFADYFRTPSGEFQSAYKIYRNPDELEAKVEADLRQWLAEQGIVERGAVWNRGKEGSPFPGLDAFDARRTGIFFGRESLIEHAARELRGDEGTPRRRFLLLLGASGSGKSSLLGAGLVPRLLRPAAIPGVESWRTLRMTAGANMFAQLAAGLLAPSCLGEVLARGALRTPELLEKQLRADADIAWRPLREALDHIAARRAAEAGWQQPRPVELLLVLDQIERCFTETTAAEREAFFTFLERCVAEGLATVLGALRSDAYAGLQRLPALLRLRQEGMALDVLPLAATELEEMLLQTASACEPPLLFEGPADGAAEQLVKRLVRDAAGGDALPLLQIALTRLYEAQEQRRDNRLAWADYQGLDQAVTERADVALGTLDEAAEARLRPLVLGLIGDVRQDPVSGEWRPEIRPLPREAFARAFPDSVPLLDALIQERLLVAEAGPQGAQVRPTHEALLRIWPRARAIVQSYAEQIHLRRKLEPRVRDWEEAPAPRKTEYLQLPALELAEARKLQASLGPILPETMRRFIAATETRARQLGRRRRALKLAAAAVVTVFVVTIVTISERARIEAQHARIFAQRFASFAAQAYFGMTTKDYGKSFHYFRQIARKGDVKAAMYVGYMYEKGLGTPRNGAKAIYWYRRAAVAGNTAAENNLGFAYEHGIDGLPVDPKKAVSWYGKAAKAGDAGAQYNLAYAYERGQDGLPKDPRKALALYREAARAGNAAAQNNLGFAYDYGLDGLARDPRKAVAWYLKAAAAGNTGAEYNLGYAYEHGHDGFPVDMRKAVAWYHKAAIGGDAAAQNSFGYAYSHGLGGLPTDPRQATYWFRLAARGGNAMAQNNLGYDYEYGLGGLHKDPVKAIYWYRMAAKAGDTAAANNLGYDYDHGLDGLARDPRQAVFWYRKAALAGDAVAASNIAFAYEHGRDGLPRDRLQAIYWYRRAARAGDAKSQNIVGYAYDHGLDGLPRNPQRAVYWYQRAALAGNTMAQNNLGYAYQYGLGSLPVDPWKAVYWYRRAARAGNAAAELNLGYAYERGLGGVPRDLQKAYALIRKSAASGYAPAVAALRNVPP